MINDKSFRWDNCSASILPVQEHSKQSWLRDSFSNSADGTSSHYYSSPKGRHSFSDDSRFQTDNFNHNTNKFQYDASASTYNNYSTVQKGKTIEQCSFTFSTDLQRSNSWYTPRRTINLQGGDIIPHAQERETKYFSERASVLNIQNNEKNLGVFDKPSCSQLPSFYHNRQQAAVTPYSDKQILSENSPCSIGSIETSNQASATNPHYEQNSNDHNFKYPNCTRNPENLGQITTGNFYDESLFNYDDVYDESFF